MDYQVVATLGPASGRVQTWRGMLAAGVTAFRLNTSHLSLPQLRQWLGRLDAFLASLTPRPPLILDLQGSKWRLGRLPTRTLASGQRVELVCKAATTRPLVLPVPHPDFFRAAAVSAGEIVLNDAKLRLTLESQGAGSLSARVRLGGEVRSRKGITYTASTYRHESLSDSDRAVLTHAKHMPDVRFALSYVKDAAEMAGYRKAIGRSPYLIAKLERQPAIDEAAGIAQSSDELWLCRGDLGAELGDAAMAVAAHRFSKGVASGPRPVLLAGQVLEHMTEHPTPTRSEVCALYDALARGFRGFVLSDEAAIGRHVVESCRVAAMFRVAGR